VTESSISKEIRERIREARQAAGLTQAQLASRYGCTQSTISGIERGRVQINARGLARMAEILGQPISYFYPSVSAEVGDLSDLERRLLREFREMPPEWQGLVVDYVGAQARLYRITEVRYRTAAPSDDGVGQQGEAVSVGTGSVGGSAVVAPSFDSALRDQQEIIGRLDVGEVDEETVLETLERTSADAERKVSDWHPEELQVDEQEVAAEDQEGGGAPPEESAEEEGHVEPLDADAERVDGLDHGHIYGDRSPEEMARLRLLELIREKAPLLSRRRPSGKGRSS